MRPILRMLALALLAAACDGNEPARARVPAAPSGAAAAGPGPDGSADPLTRAGTTDAPVEGGAEAPTAEAPTAEPAEAAPRPRRILMLGDSMVATGLGAMIERGLDAHEHISCFRKGRSSTGLARPDYFDWMDEALRQIEFRKPDTVVVILGGNDGQDLTSKSPRVKNVPWPSEKWEEVYRIRMDRFLARLAGEDRKVIWLGLPKSSAERFEAKLETIRRVQRAAVDALGPRGVYVDTSAFLVDERGELLERVRFEGKLHRPRDEDGIHFTMAGAEFLAAELLPVILNALESTPVD